MSNEKYICMNCDENKRPMIVDIGTDGKCSVCASDSVISASVFLSLQAKAFSNTKPRPAAQAQAFDVSRTKRIDSLKEYHIPIRRFLERNKLHDLNLWWDGWAFHTDNSVMPLFQRDAPVEGEQEWLALHLSNSDGATKVARFFFDPELEGASDISDELRSGNKK